MHGGAPGSGAPRGNKNALKHGLFSREAIEERRQLSAMVRQSRMLIQQIKWSPFGVCELGGSGLVLQLDEGVGHAIELQRLEPVKGEMGQHRKISRMGSQRRGHHDFLFA